MPPFKYLPLPPRHIRLLMVLPHSEGGGVLQCRMCMVSPDDLQGLSFTAMSYTWGDPTARKEIEIDELAFKTTDSVYEMLLQRGHGIWLWIDALCINQANFDERASQIRLMGRIYSKADRVVIWSGPASEDSGLAIDFIRELMAKLPGIQSNVELYNGTSIDTSDPRWAAIVRLLERPWFSRLWVIQEAVLASRSIQFSCGSRILPWKDFEFLLLGLRRVQGLSLITLDPSAPSGYSTMMTGEMPAGWNFCCIVQNLEITLSGMRLDLEQALQCVVGFSQATDRRDRIYGLYGIALGMDDVK
jgi:hypothetical protein